MVWSECSLSRNVVSFANPLLVAEGAQPLALRLNDQ
ncbi:MAG: hypothetical protein PWQ61_436 [Betaproteobacteria bacterium]|nr:hypothetical protein [Betaproteobacteria bacterium]